MEKCTDTVVNWMIQCDVIKEKEKEIYKYALHSFFTGCTAYPCSRHWLLSWKCKTWDCADYAIYGFAKIQWWIPCKEFICLYFWIWFSAVSVHININVYAM